MRTILRLPRFVRHRRVCSPESQELEQIVRMAAIGTRLSRAIGNGDAELSEREALTMRSLLQEIRGSRKVVAQDIAGKDDGAVKFIVDSLFLADAAQYLLQANGKATSAVVERFHYATGAKVSERVYTINHIVPVSFSEQSAVFLRVEDMSNFAALESLDQWGTPLLAHFHSHPGRGAGATSPSGTDRSFQERLERGGHIAVGGIFSQDGYLRFFAGNDKRFRIEVFGKQVKEIERNVYKVPLEERDLPIYTTSGGKARRYC